MARSAIDSAVEVEKRGKRIQPLVVEEVVRESGMKGIIWLWKHMAREWDVSPPPPPVWPEVSGLPSAQEFERACRLIVAASPTATDVAEHLSSQPVPVYDFILNPKPTDVIHIRARIDGEKVQSIGDVVYLTPADDR